MLIGLIGKSGCGKSVIGKELAQIMGYAYLSTGELARRIARETGDELSLFLGTMAPEDMIRDAVADEVGLYLKSGHKGIVIDGMPRFAEQVEFLEYLTENVNLPLRLVYITSTDEEIQRRLHVRGRTDDNIKAFKEKAVYFKRHTLPMVEDLRNRPDLTLTILHNNTTPTRMASIISSRVIY